MRDTRTHARTPHHPVRDYLIVAAVAAAVVAAAAWPALARASTPTTWSTVTVKSGQSVWTLAAQYPVEGMTTEEIVELVRVENELDGPIAAGTSILVPRTDVPDLAFCSR